MSFFVLAKRALLFSVGMLLLTSPGWAQQNGASVDESLETASVYVDAINGSDSNPGTQALPLQTIGAALNLAVQNNYAGVGTTILVNPGIYREHPTINGSPSETSLPITLEAITPGTAIVTGADIFTDWQAYSGNSSIYTNSWPYQFNLCKGETETGAPLEPDITRRSEMVFVNGAPMTQVLALNDVVFPGTFYVNDGLSDVNGGTPGTIYVWPPLGTDMSSATVELSTRPSALDLVGWSNMVVRGLTFQDTASCRDYWGAGITGGSNVLFDNDIFQWNNGTGLKLTVPVSNVTVQNSSGLHNGQAGFADYETLSTLWQNNTTEYNNWRGAQGAYYNWGSAGIYFYYEHGATALNSLTAFNQTMGYHWDTNNINITASGLTSTQNLLIGIMVERNNGPITLSNCTVYDNNLTSGFEYPGGAGFLLRNSFNITFANNIVYNNGGSQFGVTGKAGGIEIPDWQTGQIINMISEYDTLTGNIFEGASSTQNAFQDPELNGSDWTAFQSTLVSNNNTWWTTTVPLPFITPVPTIGTVSNFSGWQSLTQQDLVGSTFSEPIPDPINNPVLQPEGPDYWFIVDNDSLTIGADGTSLFNITYLPIGGYTGTLNLVLDGVSEVPGLSGSLSTTTLAPNGSVAVNLSALPSIVPGVYPITVIANNGSLTHTVTFLLIVPLTYVRIVPATLTFPATQVNTSSAPQSVTLTNLGAGPLTLSGYTIPSQLSETDNCGGVVAAGASCTINIVFTPNSASTFTLQLLVGDSDPASPQVINVSGTGLAAPYPTFSSTSLLYGPQPVGTSAPMSSVLTNTGSGVLNISSIAVSGSNASDFAESDNCNGVVQPSASCTITVIFTPGASGYRSATVTLTDNAPTSTQTINMTGTGTLPIVQLPSADAFNSVVLGTNASNTITLTNSGPAPLNISGFSITGANAPDFVQINTCGVQVQPSASCTITLTFTPTVNGAESASLVVTDNASPNQQTVALSGAGTQSSISFSPNPVSFANQLVGSTSPITGIVITNTGTAQVTIYTVTITGTNAGDFTIPHNCGASTLNPGASCTANVAFSPTATGARTALLTVSSSAPGSPEMDTLNGTGVQPAAIPSPASLNFGQQYVGVPSVAQVVTLSNTGNTALTINGININGGSNPIWFSQTNTCGSSLAAGATCTVSVVFTPLGQVAATSNLNFVDNAPNSPQVLPLSGTGVAPTVILSPVVLSFGSINVGASAPLTATVTNTGTGNLLLTGVAITGANIADFTETNNCPSTIVPAASCTITAVFAPVATGALQAAVTLTDNAANNPQSITLKGTATAAAVTLAPTALTFATINVGAKSASQKVTLTNSGTGKLTINSISFTGTNSADFTQTTTCGGTVNAGASCSVFVIFQPIEPDNLTASLTFNTNAADSPEIVPLSGTANGAAAGLSPASLNFGNQLVKTTSAPQSVTVTNTGNEALTFSSIALTGGDSTWFAETNTCGSSLAAGATCAINITFTPASTGSASPALTLTDNAYSGTQTIALSGTGVQAVATFAPASLSFGNIAVGSPSASQSVTMTNTGASTLSLTSITFTGTNAADFSQSNTCGSSLNAGASCAISVIFTPAAAGARTASLSFTDNAVGSPQSVPLSGTGVLPTVTLSPATLGFGTVPQGSTSAPQIVTMTNTGSVTLSIGSVTFTGTNSPDFAQTNTCGTSLAPGGSCTSSVTFTPSTGNAESAVLCFSDNASGSTQDVPLTGTGGTAVVTLSPGSLSFGTVPVGSSSTPQLITITNSGVSSLTISSITITGANAGDFAQTNTCGAGLSAGASCAATLTFTPVAGGARGASLAISDSAPGGVQNAALSGTGGTPTATISPTSVAFGVIALGAGSSAQVVTLTNSGSAPLSITSITITGANAADFTQTNSCGTTLGVGASCTASTTFTPTINGVETACLMFTDNASGNTQNVPLTGSGGIPVASLSPASVAFGTIAMGTRSTAQTVTLTNSGGVSLSISSISITGANAPDFAETSSCGSALSAGASCTVSVTFDPSINGAEVACLMFTDNASGNTQNVPLTGSGGIPVASVFPTNVAFGTIAIGTKSAPQTVTLTNSGAVALSITGIAVTGTNAPDFTQTNTCGSTLPAGASCTASVTFDPSIMGAEAACLMFTDNSSGNTQSVPLSGSGDTPVATLSPASLAFGTVSVGTRTAPQIVTLTNSGNSALSISSIAITGANSPDFAQSNTCGSSLAAGASCTASVTFDPSLPSAESASLTFSDNASGGSQSVPLSGTGGAPVATLAPSSLAFGTIAVGSSSAPQIVTLTNSGTVSLTISSVTISGPNSPDFVLTNGCGSFLAAGSSCAASVIFTPSSGISESASLTFADSASGGTQSAPLSGVGGIPTAVLSPISLTFPTIEVGSSSAPQTVTLTNTGTAPLIISGITLTGNNPGDFSQTNNCGSTMAAGASCVISVIFSPTAISTRTADVSISDNASKIAQNVPLTGLGGTALGHLIPGTLSLGSVNVGATGTPGVVTLSNTGTAPFSVTAITIGGTNASDFAQTNDCSILSAGGSCTITISFTPAGEGARAGSLTVTNTGSPVSLTSTLSGVGMASVATLSTASLSFGSENVGISSGTQKVTLTNKGNVTMTIASIAETDPADFPITANTCSATLAVNAACTVTLKFDPTSSGDLSSVLTFTTSAFNNPVEASLSGAGTLPVLSLSATSLNFGTVPEKTQSAPQILTVSNTGSGTLTITGITITGGQATWFADTNGCGTTLAAGASCTLSLTSTPLSTGTGASTLNVKVSAPAITQTVSLTVLSGTATAKLSVSNLSLGNVNVGSTGTPGNITLTNTGTISFSISSIALSGSDASDYAQSNTCGSSLAAAASCTISISFTPGAEGIRTATLTVTDTASPNTQSATLTGVGLASIATLSTTSLSFGSENIGISSATQKVTLTNKGNATMTINNIAETDATDFPITANTCGATLAVNAACTVTLKFDPTSSGALSSTLSFNTTALGSPATVSLSGSGTLPVLVLSANSLSFGTVTQNSTSAPQAVTVSNTGTGAMTITSISITGGQAPWFAQTNTCGSSLAAGASCTITVTSTPLMKNTGTSTLNVKVAVPAITQTVALSVIGD